MGTSPPIPRLVGGNHAWQGHSTVSVGAERLSGAVSGPQGYSALVGGPLQGETGGGGTDSNLLFLPVDSKSAVDEMRQAMAGMAAMRNELKTNNVWPKRQLVLGDSHLCEFSFFTHFDWLKLRFSIFKKSMMMMMIMMTNYN